MRWTPSSFVRIFFLLLSVLLSVSYWLYIGDKDAVSRSWLCLGSAHSMAFPASRYLGSCYVFEVLSQSNVPRSLPTCRSSDLRILMILDHILGEQARMPQVHKLSQIGLEAGVTTGVRRWSHRPEPVLYVICTCSVRCYR